MLTTAAAIIVAAIGIVVMSACSLAGYVDNIDKGRE
jgi:hypothetical protein